MRARGAAVRRVLVAGRRDPVAVRRVVVVVAERLAGKVSPQLQGSAPDGVAGLPVRAEDHSLGFGERHAPGGRDETIRSASARQGRWPRLALAACAPQR